MPYVPFAQGFASNVFFHVRPAPIVGLEDLVRREVRATAPGVPMFGPHADRSPRGVGRVWSLNLATSVFASFAGLAMLVALVGIYGVTAYGVERRTREIGVRMAVGAHPRRVLRMILGESLRTTAAGIIAGWLLGLGVGRVLASLFLDLTAFDPWTFGLVPAGFALAALVATWMPARRATRVNPVTALRSE